MTHVGRPFRPQPAFSRLLRTPGGSPQQARKPAPGAELDHSNSENGLAQRKKERAEFDRRVQAEREGARRAAAREFEFEIKAALKRAADAEARATKRVERIERQIPQRLRKEMAQTIRLTTRENEVKLDKLQAEREKERLRHEAEAARLQGQLDNLSRKLEKQTGERLGEEGELDLVAELETAFKKDQVERVGRGKKGLISSST